MSTKTMLIWGGAAILVYFLFIRKSSAAKTTASGTGTSSGSGSFWSDLFGSGTPSGGNVPKSSSPGDKDLSAGGDAIDPTLFNLQQGGSNPN